MRGKIGSHVGMVLSFVVFVTFLIFIFTTLQPLTETNQQKEILIDYLQVSLMDEISSNLTKITVSGVEGSKNFLKVNLYPVNLDELYLVSKNNGFVNIQVKKDGGEVYVKKGVNTGLFYIFLSPEEIVGEVLGNVPPGQDEEVAINLYQEKEYIFESKLLEFINNTIDQYPLVKDELDIPAGNEFGIAFEDEGGIIIQTEEQDVQKDVYVDKIPIEYVNSSASVLHGFLSIKVW